DHGHARHDLARGAEATLESIVLDKCRLKWMEHAIFLQPFDRRYFLAFLHRYEAHAGQYAPTVDVDGAGAALAAIARFLAAGQRQFFAERVKQCQTRFNSY